MAESTDTGDETLENPINIKSENPFGEIIPSTEPDTIIRNKTTENMEVHHHPNVEKKNLKGYILEGLMIFLAVTMGFIAENIREHITEHKNAKILAQSLLEDIKKDTASLHSLIAYSYKKRNASDSVLAIV